MADPREALPLTAADLDHRTCSCGRENCDNKVLFLHGRCHMGGRIEVSYENGTGVVTVACRECHKVIAKLQLAAKPLRRS